MVKCAVSGCPNQTVTGTQGVLDRPAKRFFNFPTDPAQVKVWLAALREADKQDWTERRLICEDHFLPEDVSKDGVSPDAIPIMPPYLDGLLGPSSSWAEEEEDEEAPDPPQQNPSGGLENPEAKTSANMRHMKQSIRAKSVPVERLTEQLLKLLMLAPDGSLDLRQAIRNLQIRGRRVFNIINVLHEIDLVQRDPVDSIRWIGAIPISSFLWKNQEKFRREMEKIRLVEDALDAIIEGCARQLLELTDGADDLAYPFRSEGKRRCDRRVCSLTRGYVCVRDARGHRATERLRGTDSDSGQSSERNQDGDSFTQGGQHSGPSEGSERPHQCTGV